MANSQILAADLKSLKPSSRKFRENFSFYLRESHMWLSIFTRNPRSFYSRSERVAVLTCGMTFALLWNIIFFGAPEEGIAQYLDTEGINFTLQRLFLALLCAACILPLSFVLTFIFRKSRPKSLEISAVNEEYSNKKFVADDIYSDPEKENRLNRVRLLFLYILPTDPLCETAPNIEERLKAAKRSKNSSAKEVNKNWARFTSKGLSSHHDFLVYNKFFILPVYFRYVGWILCTAVIIVSTTLTLLYSLSFGENKSYLWISSASYIIFMSIVIIEPMKVLITSVIATFLIKVELMDMDLKRGYPLDSIYEYTNDDESLLDSRKRKEYSPIPLEEIPNLREKEKEYLRYQDMTIDLLIYVVYAIILYWLILGTQNEWGLQSTEHAKDMYVEASHGRLPLKFIDDTESLIKYLRYTLLPTIHQSKYYNGSIIKGYGWTADYETQVVGVPRLRQHRVKPNKNCPVVKYFQGKLKCTSEYSRDTADTNDYGINWISFDSADWKEQLFSERAKQPWRYQETKEIRSHIREGEIAHYPGGGYIANLGMTRNNSNLVLDFLERHNWFDDRTRFVAIEFTLYNANVRLFNVVTLTIELGSLKYANTSISKTSYSIMTVSLFFSLDTTKVNLLLAFAFFVLILSIFMFQQLQSMLQISVNAHFSEMWNFIDVILVLLTLSSIGVFFVRNVYVTSLLQELEDASYNTFVDFYGACYVDYALTYVTVFLVCLTSVRIWKLLRFAEYFQMFETTLVHAGLPISTHMFTVFIVLGAFSVFGYIEFGGNMYPFRTPMSSLTTLVSTTIGFDYEFDVDDLFDVHTTIGQIYCALFAIALIIYCINMFIIVLMEYFSDAKRTIRKRKAKYNLLNYFEDEYHYFSSFYKKKKEKSRDNKQRLSTESDEKATSMKLVPTFEGNERVKITKSSQNVETQNEAVDKEKNIESQLIAMKVILNNLLILIKDGSNKKDRLNKRKREQESNIN